MPKIITGKKTRIRGVFRTSTGFQVRARAIDPRTGKPREITRTLDGATMEQAIATQAAMREEIRVGGSITRQRMRFADYVVRLTERKLATNELASGSTRTQWQHVHETVLLPYFGAWFVDAIHRSDVEDFRAKQGRQVQTGKLSPHTANGRLRVLLTTLRAAVADLELDRDPTAGVKPLDTSTWRSFTEEQPNALTAPELRMFLEAARRVVPEHYAFMALGFATGRRPSELRALRRKGPSPDILWKEGVMLIRRSETRGEVMDKTKTSRDLRIPLPDELVSILKWHANRLPMGDMRKSDLLFPSDVGGFRSSTALIKPIAKVMKALRDEGNEIKKHISPKAMRRTFMDLCRAAEVHDLVTRAVSGHQSLDMQGRYSSVAGDEIRGGIAKVIQLAAVKPETEGGEDA